MTTKQRAAIAVVSTLLKQIAQNLADAPARAKSEAAATQSLHNASAFAQGYLEAACGSSSKEVRAAISVLRDAFPVALKEVA